MRELTSIAISLTFLIISCEGRAVKTSSLLHENIDTVLVTDNSFLYFKTLSDTSFLAVWGSNIERPNYDTLPMFPSGYPMLYWYNKDVICVRQSCGTSCFFSYVFPIRSSIIKKIMYPMAYDSVRNLIVYTDNEDSKVFLTIENVLTGEKRDIIEKYKPGPFPGCAIDSIKFTTSGLYVKWTNANSQMKESIF